METSTKKQKYFAKLVPGQIIGGNYKLIKRVGSGAFCRVWLAETPQGSPVAIKVYKDKEYSLRRFDIELKALLKLKGDRFYEDSKYVMKHVDHFCHLGVDPQLDEHYGFTTFNPCIVVNYLGESLSDLIDYVEGGLPLETVKKITKEILHGLCVLHKNKVVHADLKTSNILLNKEIKHISDNNEIDVCISDFNTCVVDITREDLEDSFHYAQGTLPYNAPEMLLQMSFNEKVDIWSLGCICYKLLTGESIFGGDYDTESSGSEEDESEEASSEDDSEETKSSSEDTVLESHDIYSIFARMYKILGKPPDFIAKKRDYFNSKGRLKHNPKLEMVDLKKYLVDEFDFNDNEAGEIASFLKCLLQYEPSKRPSAEELLKHQFLKT